MCPIYLFVLHMDSIDAYILVLRMDSKCTLLLTTNSRKILPNYYTHFFFFLQLSMHWFDFATVFYIRNVNVRNEDSSSAHSTYREQTKEQLYYNSVQLSSTPPTHAVLVGGITLLRWVQLIIDRAFTSCTILQFILSKRDLGSERLSTCTAHKKVLSSISLASPVKGCQRAGARNGLLVSETLEAHCQPVQTV